MLEILLWLFWFIFGAYSFWFVSRAETVQPLALDEVVLIWKLHKQQTGCNSTELLSILTKRGKIIGFKCNCGYEFQQKRPITQKILKETDYYQQMQKTRMTLQNLGVHYSYVREI